MSGRGVTKKASTSVVLGSDSAAQLPPILVGHATPAVVKQVENFYSSIAEIFGSWVKRRESPHTQRAYRKDVMTFVEFLGIDWPNHAHELLKASVADVQAWRDQMHADGKAPKTLNRRVSSVSSFYKYLAGAAALMKLPITVPNPAHAQFIGRDSSDARKETRALTAARARQLMSLPRGDSVLDVRDRAILKLYLYSAIRIDTGCRLDVSDFLQDGDQCSIRIREKGSKRRTIGLHYAAGQAIIEYLEAASITRGPLFRARLNPRSKKLGDKRISAASMYRLLRNYFEQLPRAMDEAGCIFTPHSLRATAATLLLDAGVDITAVQELLGHRHVTTTQVYDKRRRRIKDSASHEIPL